MVSPEMLISGGGDHELKIWDWMTGRLQQNIVIFAAVEPFIKVTKGKQQNDVSQVFEDSEIQRSLKGSSTRNVIFVVRRISSFLSGGENHVVFSVVG